MQETTSQFWHQVFLFEINTKSALIIIILLEGYSAKSGAVAGIAACKAQAKDMTNFELKNSTK